MKQLWVEDVKPSKFKLEEIDTPDETKECTPSTFAGKPSSSISKSFSHKSSLTSVNQKQAFHQVSGELIKNLAFLNDYKPLEEVESDLYDLTRDYKKTMGSPRIRLDSIRHIHHLMQMQEHFYEITEPDRRTLQRDIEALLSAYPWALNEYRWYLKLLGLINILAVKWELINPHRYAYRNLCPPPTNSIEASEHARRQTMVFTVDTLWLAVTCTMPPLCHQIDDTSQAFSGFTIARFISLARFLISLNYNADFFMYKSIKGFCGLTGYEQDVLKVRKKKEREFGKQRGFSISGVPEFKLPQYAGLISSEHIEKAKRGIKPTINKAAKKTRVKLAGTIGFHVMDLPANFCKCMNTKFDAVNLKLRELLVNFEEAYRLFEYSTMKPQDTLMPMNSLNLNDSSKMETPRSVDVAHLNLKVLQTFSDEAIAK